jgi:hypothetical protein
MSITEVRIAKSDDGRDAIEVTFREVDGNTTAQVTLATKPHPNEGAARRLGAPIAQDPDAALLFALLYATDTPTENGSIDTDTMLGRLAEVWFKEGRVVDFQTVEYGGSWIRE